MNLSHSISTRLYAIFFLSLMATACATTQKTEHSPPSSNSAMPNTNHQPELLTNLDRAVPNSISDEIPQHFYDAVEKGTRTLSGAPGRNYWTQQADYDIDVEVTPDEKKLNAEGSITYYNNSPDTLHRIFIELDQNLHKQGVIRNGSAEITGGMHIDSFSYQGATLKPIERRGQSGYSINGTVMILVPKQPLLPGESAKMHSQWSFNIPQQGADGRMGYSEDNLLFLAYWFPKIRVYDDVNGWFTDPFLGNAEFYNDFGNYKINITAPAQWIVAATGSLNNAGQVLQKPVYDRLTNAHKSDSVMHVVTQKDFGNVTSSDNNGKVTWNFTAENVSDLAFSVTKESNWDATRTPVGDLDDDGTEDYASIDAFYRNSAPLWKNGAKFAQNAIAFLSDYTSLSYPWPHMTSVEGGGIIGGGMEFPMMTLIGAYQGRSDYSLYAVIAHELAHMWVPMQLASIERRYAWMDEGTTTFNENQAKKAYFPNEDNPDLTEFQSYTQIAETDLEGEIMRRSDYHYNGAAYGVASYPKPASILVTLRGLLGEETFNKAYHTFMQRWQFKHPYPWDLFNTFEDVSGRDLDWFWRSWYYETWTLDQAVTEVHQTKKGTRIIIQDFGQIPMPAEVKITMANGGTLTRNINVETWLRGATSVILTINNPAEITKVEIDPQHKFPDINRANNIWEQ